MKSNNEVLSIINYIEDRNGRINYDWFYHGTNYNIHVIKDILVNGIKCQKDLQIDARGSNGKYYISVSKNLGEYADRKLSAYYGYLGSVMFVLDESLPAHKAKLDKGINKIIAILLKNTPVAYRVSGFVDEYQVFRKINPSYIKGLGFSIRGMMEERINKQKIAIFGDSSTDLLKQLIELTTALDDLNLDLPIYDLSSNKEINKKKVKQIVI